MPKAASGRQKGNSKCMSISGHTDLRHLDVDLFEVSNQLRQNLSYTGHVTLIQYFSRLSTPTSS